MKSDRLFERYECIYEGLNIGDRIARNDAWVNVTRPKLQATLEAKQRLLKIGGLKRAERSECGNIITACTADLKFQDPYYVSNDELDKIIYENVNLFGSYYAKYPDFSYIDECQHLKSDIRFQVREDFRLVAKRYGDIVKNAGFMRCLLDCNRRHNNMHIVDWNHYCIILCGRVFREGEQSLNNKKEDLVECLQLSDLPDNEKLRLIDSVEVRCDSITGSLKAVNASLEPQLEQTVVAIEQLNNMVYSETKQLQ